MEKRGVWMLPHLRDFYSSVKQKTKLIGPKLGKAKESGLRFIKNSVNDVKDFDIKKVIEAVNTRALYAVCASLFATVGILLLYGLGIRFGYHVYMGNEYVASVSSKSVLTVSMKNVNRELGYKYDYKDKKPTTKLAIVKNPSSDTITKDILSRLDDVSESLVLTVNGTQLAAFSGTNDATEVLNEVLEISAAPGSSTAEFADELEFEKQYVRTTGILDKKTAVDYLTSYEIEPRTYTLRDNDTIDTVSKRYRISKEELINRNTSLTEDDFKPGTEIIVNCPKKRLSVKSDFNTSVLEEIPYETKQIDDSTLYKGMISVKKPGVAGEKEVSRISSEVDGVRVACNVISETVVKQPVIQVEAVGTKEFGNGEATGEFVRPVAGVITSRYGQRWGRLHKGVDIGANTGDPIRAADGGVVVSAGDENDGYGIKVVIDHGNDCYTLYGHCSEALVKAGMRVEKGDIIAKVGSTGDSTGPHLHFEIVYKGQALDPIPFIEGGQLIPESEAELAAREKARAEKEAAEKAEKEKLEAEKDNIPAEGSDVQPTNPDETRGEEQNDSSPNEEKPVEDAVVPDEQKEGESPFYQQTTEDNPETAQN
ncbi:MAG: peptidoglycan DD-metalloendopeptidase family protein [Oscillospiraceae bacterium]|nr:peptidoglycan DD-metalloendopeptidase family protein [Oscillospiraceae bacterium]